MNLLFSYILPLMGMFLGIIGIVSHNNSKIKAQINELEKRIKDLENNNKN